MTTSLLETHNLPVETAEPTAIATAQDGADESTPEIISAHDEPVLAEVVEEEAAAASAAVDAEVVLESVPTDAPDDAAVESTSATAPPADMTVLRQSLLQRIQTSSALPRGLQSHLASALQESPIADQDGRLLVPIDVLLSAVEQWSPSAMRLDPRSLRRGEHPAGDAFFTGDSADVSDEQAERIARQQLQRSGYLPRGGQ